MIGSLKVRLSDLILAFSRVLDFINPKVANHHLRVAIIASSIARAYGLSRQQTTEIFIAATIHDIGVFSAREKFDALEFEMANPMLHTERGYLLMKDYEIMPGVAGIIRYHHTPWDGGKGRTANGEDVPIGAHIIHLADRIEVLINRNVEILSQKDSITGIIENNAGKMFMPEMVKTFLGMAVKEYFWFDAAAPEINQVIVDRCTLPEHELDIDDLFHLSKLFGNIIDYRSPFTAVHSAGVSVVSALLAQMVGFSEKECRMMRVAGHLHDIGKLAVPLEILDKPGKLSADEFNVIRSHVYHSYRILESVGGLEVINSWGSFHHEKIDGTGYPFHLKGSNLPMGSRIMAVADIFTAITEDRPYRKGMAGENALKVIKDMADNNALDRGIVDVASANFTLLNDMRIESQYEAGQKYISIKDLLTKE